MIGAGVQAECFGVAEHRRGEHRARATATSAPRRRSSSAGAKSLVDRLARHGRGVRRRRRRARSPSGPAIPFKSFPTNAAGDRRQHGRPAAVPGGRPGRRHHPRLHARHGSGAHEGGDRRRASSTRSSGARRRRSRTRSWRGSSRSSTGRCSSTRSSACSTPPQGPDTRLMLADPQEVHEDRPAGVRADGLHGRASSRRRRCSTSRARSPRSRTTRPSAASRTSKTDMLCKPWYVGNNLAVPHPEQHRTSPSTYKDGKVVLKRRSASTSRRSTRRSPRRASGRRSSSSTRGK